jgi:hypothetical protein
VLLAEQCRNLVLERLDVLADAQRAGATPQHLDDRVDLLLVVDAAGVLDAPHT